MSTAAGSDLPVCPDPSAHEKHDRLSQAASTAALLATQSSREAQAASESRENVLGPDGRLSSKSAATSLKYAKAQDLPSFPSRGLQMDSAGAAAVLAKDYKMKDLWHPEMSQAGSKAALQAHQHGGKVDLWQPTSSSAGNSAAVLAFRNSTLSPEIDRGYTETGKNNSLLAAAKSTSRGRQRAGSTPAPAPAAYPDARNSAKNALSAATISHRASARATPAASRDGWSSEANQAARITHIGNHMKPEMFGERPPVEPELEEQRYNAALRASAVSMAKKMYEYKEERRLHSEAAEAGAGTAHRRNPSLPAQPDLRQEALQYIHLQDAAHKLAQERLAKMDKDAEAGRYREYWGASTTADNRQSRRLSIRSSRNKRASSEGRRNLDDSDDEVSARRIRQQMSQLSTGLSTVDEKKRNDDRARLLAAAEKRVHDRLHDMDQKVFQDTGKVSQAMMDDWEAKARDKAEKDRDERNKHPGQTHIGGGKYMSQAEIEAIAAARLQSTFDEINDTAAKRRARDESMERRRDLRQTELMNEKMRADELKAEHKRIRDADKAAARKDKEERKAAERAQKEEESKLHSERKAAIKTNAEEGKVVIAQDDDLRQTERMNEKMKEDELKAQFQHIKEADKAAARQEKEERKAAEKAKKEEQKEELAERKAAIKTNAEEGKAIVAEDQRKSREVKREEAAAVAGGAALAEIAERTRHDDDNDVPTESKDKRASRGMFGRIASKLRKRDDGDHQQRSPGKLARRGDQPKTAEDEAKDPEDRVGTGAAVAAGLGVPVVGATLAAALNHENDQKDDEETSHAAELAEDSDDMSDHDDNALKPAVSRTYTEPMVSPGVAMLRPDLERHVSTIQHSDDEGGDDWDSDEEEEDRDADEEDVDDREPVSPLSEEERRAVALSDSSVAPVAYGTVGGAAATAVSPTESKPNPDSATAPAAGSATLAPASASNSTAAALPAKSSIVDGQGDTKSAATVALLPGQVVGLTDAKTAAAVSQTPAPIAKNASDSRGLKGLFGKLRKRQPAAESSTPASKATPVAAAAAAAPVATSSSPADDESDEEDDPRSTSSFKRHASGPRESDDLSSSGVDEEDLARGRTGFVRKSGTAVPVAEAPGSPVSGGDDDQFEEARDHFDEALAPEPAFAGQLKSSSPVRETHFREEL